MESAARSGDYFIRVLVVGKDPLVRRGLRCILEEVDEVDIVGESGDRAATMLAIEKQRPDILLMTFSFLKETGMTFISEIRNKFSDVYVVLTGTSVGREQIIRAVEHGAFVFLPSDALPNAFASAFHQALLGQRLVMSEVAGELLFHALMQVGDGPHKNGYTLSKREREVLERMVRGMSNTEIGADLHIQLGTVKAHVSNILRKLDVADRTQAVVKAIREGLTEL